MKRIFFFLTLYLILTTLILAEEPDKYQINSYYISKENATNTVSFAHVKWNYTKNNVYGVYGMEIELYKTGNNNPVEKMILKNGTAGGNQIHFEEAVFVGRENPQQKFVAIYGGGSGGYELDGFAIWIYEANNIGPGTDIITLVLEKYEEPEVIQLLLEAGYDIYAPPNDQHYKNPWKALLLIKAPLPYFEKLISLGKSVEPEFGNGLYESPLVQAIQLNNYEIVDFLIRKGANVNREHQQKHTPLHFAAEAEDPRILRRLIEAGATVNKSDESGYTPLHRATKRKENIEILLARGANINAVTSRGQTPLMLAVNNSSCTKEIVQALLAGKPNIDIKDSSGETALIIAAKKTNRAEIITLLLNAGANAKLEDNTGRTALDWFDQNKRISKSPVRKELKDRT